MATNKVSKLIPKNVIKDGAKWLMMPSKIILHSLILWPECQNVATKIFNLFCFAGYILLCLGQFYNLIFNNLELGDFAFVLSLVMVTIETVIRRLIVYLYYERITNVIHTIYYGFWSSKSVGLALHKVLSKNSWALMIYCGIYTFCAILTGSQYIIVPLSIAKFPFGSELPFFKKSPYYELFYVWQSFLCYEIPFCICAVDIFFMCLLNNCIAQFRLLQEFLKERFLTYIESDACDEELEPINILRRFMEHHKLLLYTCKEINEIFTYYILVQFLTSMGTVCVSAFVATTAATEQFESSVTYLLGHLGEIFIYCYMGNELIYWSSQLSSALFECGWHLVAADKNLRSGLIIIMIRSQTPVRISVGGYGFLDMTSFTKLMKFSFSVYTLLDSMMKKGP